MKKLALFLLSFWVMFSSCKKENPALQGFFTAAIEGKKWAASEVETLIDASGKVTYLYAQHEDGSEIVFYLKGEIGASKSFRMDSEGALCLQASYTDGASFVSFSHEVAAGYDFYVLERSDNPTDFVALDAFAAPAADETVVREVFPTDDILALRPPMKEVYFA